MGLQPIRKIVPGAIFGTKMKQQIIAESYQIREDQIFGTLSTIERGKTFL
jgi:hypothetical protein